MATQTIEATNAQRMVLMLLNDGWLLRKDERRGWCLFQPGWARPLVTVTVENIVEMTEAGWLTPGENSIGLGGRGAKELTPLGRAFATDLKTAGWGRTDAWKQEHLRGVDIDTPRPQQRQIRLAA